MVLIIEIIGRHLIYFEFGLLLFLLLRRPYRQAAVLSLLSAGIAAGIGWLVKDFFYLPRPFIVSGFRPILPVILDGTFPSNHAAAAVAIGVSQFLSDRRLGLVFLFLAFLVAAGRVLGGVHTYTDVYSGAFLGASSAIFTVWLVHSITWG